MSYRAQEDHWVAKGAGFLIVPTLLGVGAVATKRALTRDPYFTPTEAVLYSGAALLVAYYVSENAEDVSTQAIARGAAWSFGIGLILAPALATLSKEVP